MNKHQNDDYPKFMIWVNEHKKVICCSLVFIYAIVMFGLLISRGFDITNLEYVYYVSQIISGAFVIAGVAVAVIQYTFNSNERRIEEEKQRRIEAAKLAKEFKESIIPSVNTLAVAFNNKDLQENIIQYLDSMDLDGFNKSELDQLFPKEKYEEYKGQIVQQRYQYGSTEFIISPEADTYAYLLELAEKYGEATAQ